MTDRRSIALVLGLGFFATLALPEAARADDVTLNVPVQLTNMAANVARGRVECLVTVVYQSAQQTGRLAGRVNANGRSEEFALDAAGAYNGTATVRVQVGPPREFIEALTPISVNGAPEYFCHIQVAMPGGSFHPERPRDAATGQATGRNQGPDWSQSRGGTPEVNGRLTVPPPTVAPAAARSR